MTKLTDSSLPDWLRAPAAQRVAQALEADGFQALFVGGCVRNSLLGKPVTDLDLSTDALPDQVVALSKAAGLKPVPTGIDHGTITVVADGVPVEVTTFRQDVSTDGRHAVVSFSKDVVQDASRRDFTMNALYMDRRGALMDPLNGMQDLRTGRVRFIGEARDRVAEDYLRILRFFRFHAWYGRPDQGLDGEGLAACAKGADGLAQISAERIGAELRKLLAAPDPAPSVAAMAQSGILARVLPGADAKALALLVHLEADLPPDPMRRLAALTSNDVQHDLRLSNADAKAHRTIAQAARDGAPGQALGHMYGNQHGRDAVLVRAALLEMPLAPTDLEQVAAGAEAVFPMAAQDLMPRYQGKALGQRLNHLRQIWIDSGFTLGRDQLLESLNDDAD